MSSSESVGVGGCSVRSPIPRYVRQRSPEIGHTACVAIIGRAPKSASDPIDYSIIDFDAPASDPTAVHDWVRDWITSPELVELFGAFDQSLSATEVDDRLAEAEAITRHIFDFRQGGERWEAHQTTFAPEVTQIADALITRLYRERGNNPATDVGPIDHALVLGGRINSCIMRGELLSRLVDNDRFSVASVWGLGSRRQVTAEELTVAEALHLGVVTDELDAMSAALQYTLGLPSAIETPDRTSDSEVRTIARSPRPVIGLAAARPDGAPRATTSDTYRFFLDTAAVQPGAHILIVTSAIHAPFQHAQAIAELGLPAGATVTSVGAHIATSRHSSVRTDWSTAEWLQEIRSTIWSMKNMYQSLLAAHPGLPA